MLAIDEASEFSEQIVEAFGAVLSMKSHLSGPRHAENPFSFSHTSS
jgi:hypothetical protein